MLFDRLTLELGPGEAIMVTGPNGAGKSSLLRIAAGLLAPTAGSVVRTAPVGLVDELSALDLVAPLNAALAFWARLDGIGLDAITRALDDVDLTGFESVPIGFLSTGQRRRAALARLIAGPARIWLLDEPTNGLDSGAAAALTAALLRHLAAGGTILAASHQPIGISVVEHAL
jgi:heme exporter protein A